MKKRLFMILHGFVFTVTTSLTQAAILPLESRLGGLAYYDPNLNITWAADASINGPDTWFNQKSWAAGLSIGGVTGWRLPNADINSDGAIVNCSGGGVANCSDNEMGFLSWEEGISESTPGPFSNIIGGAITGNAYWSSTEVSAAPSNAWTFDFEGSVNVIFSKFIGAGPTGDGDPDELFIRAWAVRSGDVGVVPVPAALWLFGSGLISLIGIAMRKRR